MSREQDPTPTCEELIQPVTKEMFQELFNDYLFSAKHVLSTEITSLNKKTMLLFSGNFSLKDKKRFGQSCRRKIKIMFHCAI